MKFPFNLKKDQIAAVNAWINNNHRGTILYSTGTGKTEIAFECAKRLASRYLSHNTTELHAKKSVLDIITNPKYDEKEVTSLNPNDSNTYTNNNNEIFLIHSLTFYFLYLVFH